MIDTNLNWTILHMCLENSRFVVSLLLSHAKKWLWWLIWSLLKSNWGSSVICLIKLASILVSRISGSFWHWPMWLILIDTSQRALFRMIWAWSNDLRSWVELNQRIKPFYCSPGIKTILWLIWNFWLKVRNIFRPRGHLVLFLLGWKLYHFLFTRESPPKRVFPLCCLRTLSASLMSNWVMEVLRRHLCENSVHIWPWCQGYFLGLCLSSIQAPCYRRTGQWHYSLVLLEFVFHSNRPQPFLLKQIS